MNANTKPTVSDLNALEAIRNEHIDYTDLAELEDSFFEKAELITPRPKLSLTVRYDRDIVDYFRKEVGKGYQKKMNEILKAYVLHKKLKGRP